MCWCTEGPIVSRFEYTVGLRGGPELRWQVMATIILKIIGLERVLVKKVAQPLCGLVPDVFKLMAPRVILPRGGDWPMREGSHHRVETAVRFRLRRYSAFELSKAVFQRSKPLREPAFCAPGNCHLCMHITVRTKPVHSKSAHIQVQGTVSNLPAKNAGMLLAYMSVDAWNTARHHVLLCYARS